MCEQVVRGCTTGFEVHGLGVQVLPTCGPGSSVFHAWCSVTRLQAGDITYPATSYFRSISD
jgi:hypothetical protein